MRALTLACSRQFVYLKSAFTPDLDDEVASLFQARPRRGRGARAPRPRHSRAEGFAPRAQTRPFPPQTFAEDGKLVLHYATTPAWG